MPELWCFSSLVRDEKGYAFINETVACEDESNTEIKEGVEVLSKHSSV